MFMPISTESLRVLAHQHPIVLLGTSLVITIVTCIFVTKQRKLKTGHSSYLLHSKEHGISTDKTQLLRCNISHHRLFPKSHGFVYSYLSVGVPVRSPSSNWLLSINTRNWCSRGLLQVAAKDHFNRGRDGETLAENLDAYLKQQGLRPEDFPHVYLLTSPRFLNYKFSPASFWYLYTADSELAYVIAEVNNTFDERRMYLFPAPRSGGAFKQRCLKDFHVSPFNSRKGSYLLSTADPAREGRVSVTVTLRSSKDHAKLVARWWSINQCLDPATCSPMQALWFLACWGWTVLMTYPRIVIPALYLAQVRKLSIWYRPEPRQSAVPRRATSTEVFLASIFIRYLHHLLLSATEAEPQVNVLVYSGITEQGSTCDIHFIGLHTDTRAEVQLRIHTPQFYRQMITYNSLADFMTDALLQAHEENRTAGSNNADLLVEILRTLECAERRHAGGIPTGGVFWKFVRSAFKRVHSQTPFIGVYPYPGLPHTRFRDARMERGNRSFPTKGSCFLTEFVFGHCDRTLEIRYMIAILCLQWRTRIMNAVGGE